MLRRAGTHFRSHVIGYVALFIALGGGAYAAALDKNSVKSETIKDGEVHHPAISKNDGAKGKDIDESTLEDVDAATLDGFDSTDFDVEAGYAQRTDFSENDPLSLAVPDYGTFQLLCDDNDTAGDPNDDVVRYGYSTTLGPTRRRRSSRPRPMARPWIRRSASADPRRSTRSTSSSAAAIASSFSRR